MSDPKKALAREARLLGRKVRLVASPVVAPSEGAEIMLLVYDCEPLSLPSVGPMRERRWAIYLNDKPSGSGIVTTSFDEREEV